MALARSGRLIAVAVVASALLAFAVGASQTQAQGPPQPCTVDEPLYEPEPTASALAIGRELRMTGEPTFEDGFLGDLNAITYSFEPAIAGEQVANAFETTRSKYQNAPLVEFAQGDAPAVLSWHWTEDRLDYPFPDYAVTCSRTVTRAITPVVGEPPRVSAGWDLYTRRKQPHYYTAWVESVVFRVKPAKPTALASTGPIVVRIRSAAKTRRLVGGEQLDHRTLRFTRGCPDPRGTSTAIRLT